MKRLRTFFAGFAIAAIAAIAFTAPTVALADPIPIEVRAARAPAEHVIYAAPAASAVQVEAIRLTRDRAPRARASSDGLKSVVMVTRPHTSFDTRLRLSPS